MTEPRLFRKRPVTVEAIRYDGANERAICEWAAKHGVMIEPEADRDPGKGWHLNVRTLEGTMRADVGHWIIRGVKGEMYPCAGDVFEATYESVNGQVPHG